MSKKKATLTLLLSTVLMARLYHVFSPRTILYHLDTWPLLYNTEQLLKYTPTPLDSAVFDGYNNYWPGVMLETAALKVILGTSTAATLKAIIPAASSALYVLVIAILAKRLTSRSGTIYLAVPLAALFPLEALFHTAPVKETLAFPLMLATIYLAFYKNGLRNIVLVSVLTATTALTHHLTTAVLIASTLFTALYLPLFASRNSYTYSGKALHATTAILASAAAATAILPIKDIGILEPAKTLPEFAVYYAGMFTTLLLASKDNPKKAPPSRKALLATLTAASLALIGLEALSHIFAGIPSISAYHLALGLPYLALAPAVAVAPMFFKTWVERAVAASLFSSIFAVELYSLFAPSAPAALQYRAISFLAPITAIMASEGLFRAGRGLSKTLAAFMDIVIIALFVTASTNMLSGSDPLSSVQVYTSGDLAELGFASTFIKNRAVVGDAKVYYAAVYYNMTCAPQCLLKADSSCRDKPLIIHWYNGIHGFYLFDEPLALKIAGENNNIAYNNGGGRIATKT